jgi:hypothetical protein
MTHNLLYNNWGKPCMQPILVTPLNDPQGFIFLHLQAIEPVLKQLFSQAVLGVTRITFQGQPQAMERLGADPFYVLFPAPEEPVGRQFAALFRQAVTENQPGQILHLCFLDRLAFILQGYHHDLFMQEISALRPADTPLLFTRSVKAWNSHPRNYCEIEQFSSRVGEYLFGRTLDFAWCHLAVQASVLGEALAQVRNSDLSVLAEIVLDLMDSLRVKEVDWLEWEDPFLLGREPAELKSEREASRLETEKRLAYILPTLHTMIRYGKSQERVE